MKRRRHRVLETTDHLKALAMVVATVLAAGLLAGTSQEAEAAFPGENGKFVFASDRVTLDNPEGDLEIFTMDPGGGDLRQLTSNGTEDNEPAFSADGKKIVFHTDRDGNFEIYTMNALDGTEQTNRSNNAANEFRPAYAPDGQKIAFESNRTGNHEIFTMDANGANQTNVTNNSASDQRPAFSPDGATIAFQSDRTGDSEIFTAGSAGANPTNLTNSPANEYDPNWDPDGRDIAFTSDRDGNNEIYVKDVVSSFEWRVTYDPGLDVQPAFSPDGSEMTFSSDRDGNYEVYVRDQFGVTVNRTSNPAFDASSDWGIATPDFVVTNTYDSGAGSLRQAIEDANAAPDRDMIGFDIPGTGVKTISLSSSGLPHLTDPVTIDGYTQPGASRNTLQNGTNAKLLVELNGEAINGAWAGLAFSETADDSVVRGLVINRFGASGIFTKADSMRIEGNFIGTNATGTAGLGNDGCGVDIFGGSSGNVGGGPAGANVISGNSCGVLVSGPLAAPTQYTGIYGNLIGTAANGRDPLPNGGSGVLISQGAAKTETEENTVAFNAAAGIRIEGEGNEGNGGTHNSVHSNGGLGIDLGAEGVTPNDELDADAGPNGLQNYPKITSVSVQNGATSVAGTLHSAPNTDYHVHLYSSPGKDPSGFGEGRTHQEVTSVRTDDEGNASFTLDEPENLGGQFVTMTAVNEVTLDASEFSEAVLIDTTPPNTTIASGPPSATRSTFASFSFSSEAGATFECKLDGGSFAPCSSPKGYPVANGSHTFSVRATDAAGNGDATPASRAWTVDTVVPTISGMSPANGSTTRNKKPTIRATVRDNLTNLQKANVKLYVNGAMISPTRWNYSSSTDLLTYSPKLPRGKKTVRVEATDAAGNKGTRSWYFKVR